MVSQLNQNYNKKQVQNQSKVSRAGVEADRGWELHGFPRKSHASLVVQMVKNQPAMQETWVRSLGWGGGHGNPLQYSCLENPQGQRSLAGYSPWGHKEADMTEPLITGRKSHAP